MVSAQDSALHVCEGFEVDKLSGTAVRPPQLQIPASGLSQGDLKHPGSFGISGLLQMCNVNSTCQVTSVPKGSGTPATNARIQLVGSTNLEARPRRLVRTVARGLKAHQEPEAATEGLGGTYFFMNEFGQPAALMKPCDEEPLAPNNPKGFIGRQLGDPGLKSSVKVGEAAIREVAAYLLDHDHLARVPATVLVRLAHPVFHIADKTLAEDKDPSTPGEVKLYSKLGSLQEYTQHVCDSSEVGTSRFNTKNIHRIGILDLRLLNTDRHAGNLLVRRFEQGSTAQLGVGSMILDSNQLELVPIDHGFCLPDNLEPPYFEWLHWPQAMMPFDEEELEFIAELDPEKDAAMLREQLPMLREDCLRTLIVATILLKRCAAAGLALSEIGSVYSRPLVGVDEEPSELERMCTAAWQHVRDYTLDQDDIQEALSEENSEDLKEDDSDEELDDNVVFGVSDSASSHLSSHNNQFRGSCEDAKRLANLDSPQSLVAAGSFGNLSTPGSLHDLLFDLDDDESTPTPKSLMGQNRSLHGEADSWSLAAFSVSSVCVLQSPHQAGANFKSGSEEDLVELAHSVRPMSEINRWRRKASRDVGLLGTAPRVRCKRAAYPPRVTPCHRQFQVGGEPTGAFSDLDDSEWDIFLEGFRGHVDAALQAGLWKACNQPGYVASRGMLGTSAPA